MTTNAINSVASQNQRSSGGRAREQQDGLPSDKAGMESEAAEDATSIV
jgi:hypothetical protein